MKLFHGTSRQAWQSIQREGVEAPSYWGSEDQAQAYADSFGAQGVVLVADLDEGDLEASLLMAQAMMDAGDLDALPASDDVAFSLEYLGGVTCTAVVRDAECLTPETPKRRRRPN